MPDSKNTCLVSSRHALFLVIVSSVDLQRSRMIFPSRECLIDSLGEKGEEEEKKVRRAKELRWQSFG